MRAINKMINKTIIEITIMIVLCIISFAVFNIKKLDGVIDNVTYTDIDVLNTQNAIGINDFSNDEQIVLTVSNYSNTSEAYNVLLTSSYDLSKYEDNLRIKIDDKDYLLKDLKVADNYFLIDQGNMKSNSKIIKLYFAIDDNNDLGILSQIPFYFVNDLTI